MDQDSPFEKTQVQNVSEQKQCGSWYARHKKETPPYLTVENLPSIHLIDHEPLHEEKEKGEAETKKSPKGFFWRTVSKPSEIKFEPSHGYGVVHPDGRCGRLSKAQIKAFNSTNKMTSNNMSNVWTDLLKSNTQNSSTSSLGCFSFW